jgi:hypothetical protein
MLQIMGPIFTFKNGRKNKNTWNWVMLMQDWLTCGQC